MPPGMTTRFSLYWRVVHLCDGSGYPVRTRRPTPIVRLLGFLATRRGQGARYSFSTTDVVEQSLECHHHGRGSRAVCLESSTFCPNHDLHLLLCSMYVRAIVISLFSGPPLVHYHRVLDILRFFVNTSLYGSTVGTIEPFQPVGRSLEMVRLADVARTSVERSIQRVGNAPRVSMGFRSLVGHSPFKSYQNRDRPVLYQVVLIGCSTGIFSGQSVRCFCGD